MDNASSSAADDVVQAAKSSGVLRIRLELEIRIRLPGCVSRPGPSGMTRNTLMRSRCQDLRARAAARAASSIRLAMARNSRRRAMKFRRTCTNGTRTRSVWSLTRLRTRVDDDTNPSPGLSSQRMPDRYAQNRFRCYQLPSDSCCDETEPVTKSHYGTFCCRLADEKPG
jgi:hypothetical protein